jgi:hypothetical protein
MFVACLFLALTQGAKTTDDPVRIEPKWNTLTVLEDQGLIVRCKVRQRVSPADAGWIVLELENQTDKPIHIKQWRYNIKFERLNVKENRQTAHGGLAQNDFSPQTYEYLDPARGEGGIVPPRAVRRCVDMPSDAATASLLQTRGISGTLWRRSGLDRLKFFPSVDIQLADGRELTSDPMEPVECEWWYPNEKDVEGMKQRLRRLLQNPYENGFSHSTLVLRLLDWPDVGSSMTREELFQAILRRSNGACRNFLMTYYKKRFPDDQEWAKYQKSLDDIRVRYFSPQGGGVASPNWDKSHVESLVRLYEAEPHAGYCLRVLNGHRDDWIQNKEIVARLTAATIRNFPVLQKKLALLETREKESWCRAVTELARCGDPEVIPRIQEGLADNERVQESKFFANDHFPIPPPPLRVCDSALHAILTILDGSPDGAYRKAGYTPIRRRVDEQAQLDQLRDGMIETLKKRLQEQKP